MKNYKNLLLLGILAIFVCLSGCSTDPITTGVSGVVTAEVAGEVMDDIDQKVSNWLNNTAIQTNNVASDLVNQVDSMRVNILSDADYLADKQIANLDVKLQHKINSLNNAVAQLEKSFAQDATKISREASLSIREALWGLPFTGEDLAVSYRIIGDRPRFLKFVISLNAAQFQFRGQYTYFQPPH